MAATDVSSVTERVCLGCGKALTRRQANFCSRACRNRAYPPTGPRKRRPTPTCKHCGKPFAWRKGTLRFCTFACYQADRRDHGTTLVRCAYTACPTPDEPIRLRASRAAAQKHVYHPACWPLARSENGARRGLRSGAEATCLGCGKALGYKPPTWFRQGRRYCRSCGWRLARRAPRTAFLTRACAYCGIPVERWASEDAGRVFCSRAHYAEYRAVRQGTPGKLGWLVCRTCGTRRRERSSWTPKSLDPETGTYRCQRCRAVDHGQPCGLKGCRNPLSRYQAHYCSLAHAWAANEVARQRLTCEFAGCRKPFYVTPFWAGRRRFCTKSCASRARVQSRRGRVCATCGAKVSRPGGRFCKRGCYTVWLRGGLGGPSPRSAASRAHVLDAWQRGVRGPRAIAAAAHASISTVYKVLQSEGKYIGSDGPSSREELDRRRDAEWARLHPAVGSHVTFKGCEYTLVEWQPDGRPVLEHAPTSEYAHVGLRVVVALNRLRDIGVPSHPSPSARSTASAASRGKAGATAA